jgi:hypothetical protein
MQANKARVVLKRNKIKGNTQAQVFTRKLDELRNNLKNLRTKIGSSESISP